ncbi:MAG: hypothetical protein OEQ47_18340 [Acidimicrobiia bacterium]|nr:hypothetical protein [Acidimicrobiia bacterium]
MRSPRTVGLLVGLALVIAACGGGASENASPAEASTTTPNRHATPTTAVQSSQPDSSPTNETAQPADERPAPDPNREIAPDFDLLLGDGSTFVLSEETRPVFMVFWAEW